MYKTRKAAKIFPFLYLVFYCIWQYSVNDMATSTNAYQEQGNRTVVYIFLVLILALMGLFFLKEFYYGMKLYPPCVAVLVTAAWVFLDNLLLGNFFNGSRWTAITHFGLSVWWFLALVFGYYYPKDNSRKEKQITVFLLFMFGYYCSEFIKVAFESNATHDETTVLNLVYRILVFVPVIYMLKNKKLRNVLLLFVFLLTVLSMKRGAIIVLPIMLLVAFSIEGKQNPDSKPINKLISAIAIAVVAIAVFLIADHMTDGFLSNRFSWESLQHGSSRSEKYAFAWNSVIHRDFLGMLIGIGSGKRGGVHNEVLEFLYTFGIVGLVLYIIFLISIIQRFVQLNKVGSRYAANYGMIVVFVVIVGLYSGVYFTHSTFYLMLFIGILERKIDEENLSKVFSRRRRLPRRRPPQKHIVTYQKRRHWLYAEEIGNHHFTWE